VFTCVGVCCLVLFCEFVFVCLVCRFVCWFTWLC